MLDLSKLCQGKKTSKFFKGRIIHKAAWIKDLTRRTYLGSRVGQLMVEQPQCICVKCGVEGNLVVTHRHKNEIPGTRHIDVFALDEKRFVMMTLDHILPASYGGKSDITNYRIMCRDCNQERSNVITDDEIKTICERLEDHVDDRLCKEHLVVKFSQLVHARKVHAQVC
jgi:5-methylcytosine-specific restriction endonuclease McrA